MLQSELKDKISDFYFEAEEYEEVFNCSFILVDKYDDAEGYGWLGYLYYYGEGIPVDLKLYKTDPTRVIIIQLLT